MSKNTAYVSKPKLVSSFTIVNMMSQFGASLTDDSRVVIHDHNVFLIQATVYYLLVRFGKETEIDKHASLLHTGSLRVLKKVLECRPC